MNSQRSNIFDPTLGTGPTPDTEPEKGEMGEGRENQEKGGGEEGGEGWDKRKEEGKEEGREGQKEKNRKRKEGRTGAERAHPVQVQTEISKL